MNKILTNRSVCSATLGVLPAGGWLSPTGGFSAPALFSARLGRASLLARVCIPLDILLMRPKRCAPTECMDLGTPPHPTPRTQTTIRILQYGRAARRSESTHEETEKREEKRERDARTLGGRLRAMGAMDHQCPPISPFLQECTVGACIAN